MLKKTLFYTAAILSIVFPNQKSEAFTIGESRFKCLCYEVEVEIGGAKVKVTKYLIDPVNVKSFQFDFNFNPAEEEFLSLEYIAPYIELQPPDLSNIVSGKILDIAGTTSTIPSGNANLVELTFLPLVSNPTLPTVSLSSNDFITVFDTNTGQTTTLTSLDIPNESCKRVPEPTSTLSLLAIGTLGAASTLKSRLKPSKTSEKETTKVG
jgi:hypothetical protein